jgi:hypothetical protein
MLMHFSYLKYSIHTAILLKPNSLSPHPTQCDMERSDAQLEWNS